MKTLVASLALCAAALATSLATSAAQAQAIRTGLDATFAPHAMPLLGGGVEGFNVDLAREIAKRLGRPIEIDATAFSGLIPGLNAKRYDWIAAPTTITKERAELLLFTEGYLETNYQFVLRGTDADIKTLDDLKGKVINVNKGSIYEAWVKANAERLGFRYEVFDTNPDALQAVMVGRVYANLTGNTTAAWAVRQNPKLKLSAHVIDTGLAFGIPFRKDDKAGRDSVSMAIKCIKHDGTMAKLHEKWLGFKPGAESWAVKSAEGHGQPGMAGYDAAPVKLECK